MQSILRWLSRSLVPCALLLADPANAGRCGPVWTPPGHKCGNSTCGCHGPSFDPERGSWNLFACVALDCGYHQRSLLNWRAVLPQDLVEPFTPSQATVGVGVGSFGATQQVDGRVRISETFAVRVRQDSALWPEPAAGGDAGLVMNVPSGSRRIHLGLHAAGAWRDGPGGFGGMTAVAALDGAGLNAYMTMEAGSRSSTYFARGTAGAAWSFGSVQSTRAWRAGSLLAGGRIEQRGDLLLPSADVLAAATGGKWLIAAEGRVGAEWSLGVRIGQWTHPEPYAW